MQAPNPTSLAVVPIFMSAGAAVLPTVIAAFTSVAAVVFKPRELARQFRTRPAMMSTIALSVLAVAGLIGWWAVTPAKAATRITRPSKTDWAEVARTILAQERLHAVNTSAPATVVSTLPQTGPAQTSAGALAPDFSRTMFTGATAPLHLTQLWKYHPDQTMFLSDPALSSDGKRLYVAGCISDLAGYVGILACVNAETGKPIWEVAEMNGDVMKPFFSSPTITADGKYLIIGQGLHQDKDCALMCFDTENGKLKWSVKTPIHIESSPAVLGDLAVVGAGAIEGSDGKPTGDPGFVFAVRISDGKKLWQYALNDAESSPVIDADGTVYAGSGFNGNAVVALRSETDDELKAKNLPRLKWSVPAEFPVTGALTLAGDLVISGGGNSDMVHSAPNAKGQVMAINRTTGKVAWSVTVGDSILGSMAAADGMVVCPCRTGEVIALSLKDGGVLWRQRINGRVPVIAGTAAGAGRVYSVSDDGYLGILDAKNGDLLEKIYLNEAGVAWSGFSMSTPLIANGRLIVGSETGGVRMYVGDK
jgi:outer membrane protein assembly factor BamB